MTPGLGLAMGAMICYGVGDLVYKRAASAGAAAHRFLMVQAWIFGIVVLLYGLVTGTLVFNLPVLWGAVAGVFAFTGFYNFARSLRTGNVSINAPIFRLSFTVTAALAVVLLGETVNAWKITGLALALGAVWLLLGGNGRPAAGSRMKTGSLVRVLVATLAVAIANLIYKIGLQAGATPASLLVVQAGVVITMSSTMVGIVDRRIRPTATTVRHAAVAAVILAVAFIFLLESLARGPASVLVPVAQMGFVVTATIGFLLLREPFTVRKGLGIAVAFAALGSLALS